MLVMLQFVNSMKPRSVLFCCFFIFYDPRKIFSILGKNNDAQGRTNTEVLFLILGFERLKFLLNDDGGSIQWKRFVLQLCLGMYPVNKNTKLLLKGSQTFSLHDSRACSDNCLLIRIGHGTKQVMEPSWDVLLKSSSFLSFITLLLIVGLFLRMVSINRKTEMNERGKLRWDRITADNRPQKRNGDDRE